MNFDLLSPPQLEPGLAPTEELISLYLERKGVRVHRIARKAFQAAWDAARGRTTSPISSSHHYAATLAAVLDSLSEVPDGAALVVANIVYRPAEIVGVRGRWDRVSRPVLIDGLTEKMMGALSAEGSGVSTRVRVYSHSGELIHDGHGGIDLPWKLTVSWRGDVFTTSMVERSGADIFEDPVLIARSIMLAFDPYIPR